MRKVNFLTLVSSILLCLKTFAQDGDVSMFNKPKSNSSEGTGTIAKYAIFINPSYLFRGGATIGAQAFIFKGLVASFEYGASINDYQGKLDFFDTSILPNQEYYSTLTSSQIGSVYEFGLKYYFNKGTDDIYIGLYKTSINNSTTRKTYNNSNYSYSSSNFYPAAQSFILPYTSNEYKFMVGKGYESDHFFADYNFGFGFRNVSTTYISQDEVYFYSNGYNTSSYIYSKKTDNTLKLKMYMSIRYGYKF